MNLAENTNSKSGDETFQTLHVEHVNKCTKLDVGVNTDGGFNTGVGKLWRKKIFSVKYKWNLQITTSVSYKSRPWD